MDVKTRLAEYYAKSPFGADGGLLKEWATVYAGPYLIQIPNTQRRRYLIPYHDLHHVVAGYNNSRIGEGEIGAWELGTDCWQEPIAVLLNLAGMSTGLLYSPSRIYRAFMHGAQCRNLYDLDSSDLLGWDYADLQAYVKSDRSSLWQARASRLRFAAYFVVAAGLTIPVVMLGFFLTLRAGQR